MVSTSLSCLLLIILITASLLGSATAAAADAAAMSLRHEKWMAEHRRIYEDASEKTRRFEIFKLNVEYIDTVNNNISSSSSSRRKYKLGVNQFADLTNEEFKALQNGFRPKFMKATAAGAFENPAVVRTAGVPSAVDWRRKGAVTPVKNQGQCGSCWAFSAVASTEGIIKLKTGRLTALSVQELLDCDVAGVNKGCAGGATDAAFEFIIGNGGLATDASYPYEASAGTCNATAVAAAAKKEATISGYVSVANIGEARLAEAVARQPVSVAVDAGGPDFQFYAGGVFSGECGADLNHGMAVVGFGKRSDGAKYWILKNSWGVSWGESGYMRLQRDVGGLQEGGRCGVAMYAAYPTV